MTDEETMQLQRLMRAASDVLNSAVMESAPSVHKAALRELGRAVHDACIGVTVPCPALAAEVARRDAETCRHVVEMQKLREEWDRLRAAAEAVLEQVEDGGCGDCVYCGEPVEACDFDNLDGDDESCKGFVLRRALTALDGSEVQRG